MAYERSNLRWDRKAKQRAARRFRAYVNTKSHPQGRIVRLPCAFWNGVRRGRHKLPPQPTCLGDLTEAHHVDYDRPFLVAWLCRNCHALVHSGKLKLYPSLLCDYGSLVAPLMRSPVSKGPRSRKDAGQQDMREYEPAPF